MRSSRVLTRVAAVALVAALGTMSACGSDDSSDATDSGDTSSSGNPAAGDDETDTASGGLIDICTLVTDEEIGEILGGPVTREEIPGGGCSFDQEDLRAPSVDLNSSVLDEGNGGFDGSVSGLSAQFEGEPGAAVDGIGDQAYAETGTVMGGENQQGGGLVRVGSSLFQVGLVQGVGLSADEVQTLVVNTLTLMATKV